jgi:hypothetical protein
MFEAFTKLIDVLITLVTRRATRSSRVFTEVIKPFMDELVVIHGTYIEVFERTTLALKKPTGGHLKDLQKTEAWLEEKRREGEAARRKIAAASHALATARDFPGEFIPFVRMVFEYFYAVVDVRAGGPLTRLTYLLDEITNHRVRLEQGAATADDLAGLLRSCNETLSCLRDKYAELCREYTRIQVKVLA